MKASFNNNLPNQTNDVIVNPENPVNPDSKLMAAASVISKRRLGAQCIFGEVLVFWEYHL
jgi:hypothetical protein